MTNTAQQTAAAQFAEFWAGKGDEKQETSRFWIDLLHNVLGISNVERYIEFEKRVKLSHTSFIDAYIPETKVLIEQKGAKVDLHKAYEQSDGALLTPYQQAKRYVSEMKASEKPRWIVVCNFQEFLVYDLEKPGEEPEQIFLKDLPEDFYRLQFLANQRNENIRREEEISLKAGELVGKLYDALIKEYINPDEKSLRSLNILCVRLVFCFYAEDAGLFGTRTAFEDYLRSFALENVRKGLIDLFKALDTKPEDRDKYDQKMCSFPYVNGGLFRDEQIEIPNFTQEILDVICNNCAPFNWSDISPTIFGAVFESTLNPETRRKGGMHYTSIANIHKVIDPLFLDDLEAEFEAICADSIRTRRTTALHAFQQKLGSLKFLDPACGSGNFLTETYLSLRRLENRILKEQGGGMGYLGFDEIIYVKINQFYGIEINDFAVTVAKTALWIAESQMIHETESILSQDIDFLPLTDHANIIEGNALRLDWTTLSDEGQLEFLFADKLNVYKVDEDFKGNVAGEPATEYGNRHYKELNVVAKQVEEKTLPENRKVEPVVYDYIIGNPPFVGYAFQSERQKEDLSIVDSKMGKNIDYVVGWYIKAARVIQNTKTKCAFVSTNSITQGEQVAEVWKPLFEHCNIQFDFAYRTFVWDSESTQKAHVHCVILGFSDKNSAQKDKIIFDKNGNKQIANNINPYLLDAPTVFVESRKDPLCKGVSIMNKGSQGTDDGAFYFTEDEYNEIVNKTPAAAKFLRETANGQTFLHGEKRYCLWCADLNPAELKKIPELARRVEQVKQFRLASPKAATRKWAAYPYLFTENRQPESGNYLILPLTSGESREYVPIDYLPYTVIANNSVQMIPNASIYDFGILTSNVFMAWMRAVCGRLKSDYRITVTNVYNNFPWCNATDEQRKKIEQTAQTILDVRAKFNDSTFADLYDSTFMLPELRKAHEANDKAVMAAYGFDAKIEESEIVARLFEMYEDLVKKQ